MTVDGAAASEEPSRRRGRAGRDRGGAAPLPAGRRPERFRSRSSTRTSSCSWSTSRPGVVSHPAPGHGEPTLPRSLPEGSRLVHRLDKDTSGLLLVARSEEVLAELQRMMKAREITREYTALVEGHPGRRERHDRRPDRARPRQPHGDVHAHGQGPRGGHPFRGRRAAPAHRAAPREAGDRPHAPDPRTPRSDRASGRRRPPVRRQRKRPPARPRAAISSRFNFDV